MGAIRRPIGDRLGNPGIGVLAAATRAQSRAGHRHRRRKSPPGRARARGWRPQRLRRPEPADHSRAGPRARQSPRPQRGQDPRRWSPPGLSAEGGCSPLPRRDRQADRQGSPSDLPGPPDRWLGPWPSRPGEHRTAHPDRPAARHLERSGVAFLPDKPFHEHHQVQPLAGLAVEQWPRDKAVVGLVDAGAGALAVAHSGTWLGHIIGRPDLVAYINTVTAAGLPPTARLRVSPGGLIVPLADQDATISHLARLGSADLVTVRRKLAPTGRWACQRCGRLWQDPRRPGPRWYDLSDDDGPHVCPGCFSFAFTNPM